MAADLAEEQKAPYVVSSAANRLTLIKSKNGQKKEGPGMEIFFFSGLKFSRSGRSKSLPKLPPFSIFQI